ncbi:MAG: radical SAM protein [Pseudomonas sp.]
MKIIGHDLLPFDMQYPVYNFFYPNSGVIANSAIEDILTTANNNAKKRALYIHIPFCDTICSFCPFTRGRVKDINVIEYYVQALIKEIEWKTSAFNFSQVPINAIFFGGGTPSMMTAEQIERVGAALHRHFNLSEVKEFSFEVEVKSLTLDKANAMKHIGVTHPRFGLQTFSKKWRDIFTLTATLEQIHNSIEILSNTFSTISFDILYGMSGHTEDELISDLMHACDTGVSNIDIYPIDNIMTQPGLHKTLNNLKHTPMSATRKFTMNILVDSYMRTRGYMPHNGHGYRKVGITNISNDVIYNGYKFEYHEHVYGYPDYDLIGFGVSAISSLYGAKLINTDNRSKYISHFTEYDHANGIFQTTQHEANLDKLRPLALRLPYFGSIEKNKLSPNTIWEEEKIKIESLKMAGLLNESETEIALTKTGWYNYVNIMYYLLPKTEQQAMDGIVADQLTGSVRDITENEIFFKI